MADGTRIMQAAMTAAWNSYGVIVDQHKMDPIAKRMTIYISVPSSSDLKNVHGEEMAGSVLSKRFSETLNDMVKDNPYAPAISVIYKIRDVHWTKEMADKAKVDTLREFYDPFM